MCDLSDYHTKAYSVSTGFRLYSETIDTDYYTAENLLKSKKVAGLHGATEKTTALR